MRTVREIHRAKVAGTKNVPPTMPTWNMEQELPTLSDDVKITSSEIVANFAGDSIVEYALDLVGWDSVLSYWEYNMLNDWARAELAFDD